MGKYLPTEIITDMLSRLPSESLLQCKLVCKPWRDLMVNDPSFTHMHTEHLRHHSSGKVSFIFQVSVPEEIQTNVRGFYYAEFDKANEKLITVKDVDLTHRDSDNGTIDYDTLYATPWEGFSPWLTPGFQAYEEIVGSCNGLICMTVSYNIRADLFYKPLYVCNPVTRECVVLPVIIDDSYYDIDVETWEGDFSDGFGYSPLTDEYKVVRIYDDAVYVYTLGDGKGWRNIGPKEFKSGIGEYIHGAYNQLDKDWNLVSFDLEDEKFGLLPSPPCFHYWQEWSNYQVREDGKSLSIFHKNQKDHYDMWVLKKKKKQDCQSWSWIKEETLYDDRDIFEKVRAGVPKPFAITMDGGEVLFNDSRFFYRHDLKTRTSYPLVGFEKCLIPRARSICRAVCHVNSLVSLKALGERNTTRMIENGLVLESLVPKLTYNVDEEEKITSSNKRKERTHDFYSFF